REAGAEAPDRWGGADELTGSEPLPPEVLRSAQPPPAAAGKPWPAGTGPCSAAMQHGCCCSDALDGPAAARPSTAPLARVPQDSREAERSSQRSVREAFHLSRQGGETLVPMSLSALRAWLGGHLLVAFRQQDSVVLLELGDSEHDLCAEWLNGGRLALMLGARQPLLQFAMFYQANGDRRAADTTIFPFTSQRVELGAVASLPDVCVGDLANWAANYDPTNSNPKRFAGDLQRFLLGGAKTSSLEDGFLEEAVARPAFIADRCDVPEDTVPTSWLWAERSLVLSMVAESGLALRHAPEELRADREVVQAAVQGDHDAFAFAAPVLQADREFVLNVVSSRGLSLAFASPHLRSDGEIVLAAVQSCGLALAYAAEQLRDQRDIVLHAVREDGAALAYASPVLRADLEVVTAAVEGDGLSFEFADAGLRSDRGLALAAARVAGDSLAFAASSLRGDFDFVLGAAALSPEPLATLRHAARELWAARDFALAAVACCGLSLRLASPPLRGDREVVAAAALNDWRALVDAAPECREDAGCVLAAVRCAAAAAPNEIADALALASDTLEADREFCFGLAAHSGVMALRFASRTLRGDRDLVLKACAQDGQALAFAAPALRADCECVLTAVQQSGLALNFASEELLANPGIALAAVRRNGAALALVAPRLQADREVVLAAVQQSGVALAHAAAALRADVEIAQSAVMESQDAFQFVDGAALHDPVVLRHARPGDARLYASESSLQAAAGERAGPTRRGAADGGRRSLSPVPGPLYSYSL
ncbi:unnamed protein product, partial [Prorocentrum cordatum]